MPCSVGRSGVVCFGFQGSAKINGRTYRFDWNSLTGPEFFRRKDGKTWEPGEKHEAWKAADNWFRRSPAAASLRKARREELALDRARRAGRG